MATILVCGSRLAMGEEWGGCVRSWLWWVGEQLQKHNAYKGTRLIHGDATGIDTIAANEARAMGWLVKPFPADWVKHPKTAGPIRNRQMFEEGKPDLGITFGSLIKHRTGGGVKLSGTGDMVSVMNAGGVQVFLVSSPDTRPMGWINTPL